MKYLLLSLLFLFSCNNSQKINADFDKVKNDFITDMWKIYPDYATYMGFHDYDSVLYVPDGSYNKKQIDFADAHLAVIKKFDPALLNTTNKTDYYMIENQLNSIKWEVNSYRGGTWLPSVYNLGGIFYEILNYKKQHLETRLSNISKKLSNVPAYYASAKVNLTDPTLEHTNLAILQNKGSVSVFDQSIRDSVKKSSLNEEQKNILNTRLDQAFNAINDYVLWLEKDLKPSLEKNARSFRLGKELYDAKFKYDIQASRSAEEIYQSAFREKEKVLAKMTGLLSELWPKYFKDKKQPDDSLLAIRQVIDVISLRHVQPDSFMAAIKKQIPQLVDFINKKNLIYLDPSKPLIVRETPLYMRGIAGASISSPGPYDKDAETFYNVTPLDGMSPEAAESYLREYNYYILQILNMHEAIPGHYTQLIYSNKSPSIIKSVLGNGTMIEGWAVYAERMMMEEGYNNAPEMWLMYYKWYLRSVCNTILDYSVHVLNMSEEEAMDLLIRQAFQEKTEASKKWRRVQLTQVQLCSYFTGFDEIYSLRADYKAKMGNKYNIKDFNEKFLSYGSAPVKYIRQLMLQEN